MKKIPRPLLVCVLPAVLVNLASGTGSSSWSNEQRFDAGFLQLDKRVEVSVPKPKGLVDVAGAYDFITNPSMSAFFIVLLITQVLAT